MLCLSLTGVILPNADPSDLDVRYLTPSHLAAGSGFDEPVRDKSYGINQYTIFDAQEDFIRDPQSVVVVTDNLLYGVAYDIERIDLQEILKSYIDAASKAKRNGR